jgi:hypothetical protein
MLKILKIFDEFEKESYLIMSIIFIFLGILFFDYCFFIASILFLLRYYFHNDLVDKLSHYF